jgi:PmbA protein
LFRTGGFAYLPSRAKPSVSGHIIMPLSPTDALNVIEAALAAAAKAGASSADALMVAESSVSISWRLGRLEDVARSESQDLGLRVFSGQSSALVSTSDFSSRALSAAAERAVAMAKLAPPDPYAGLAAEAAMATPSAAPLDLDDGASLEADRLRDMAAEAEDAARAVPGVTNSEGAGGSSGRSSVALGTSAGFRGSYSGSSYSISASVVAGGADGMERDYAYHSVRHATDLDSPAAIGTEAGERAVKRLGAEKLSTGTMVVVFDPRVSGGLVGHLLGAINGRSVARRSTFLLDKLGEQIFSAGIQIIDDPLLPRGLRSKPFDGEGVATRRHVLIDDGRLTSWLLDSASARQLGLATNGHASRGISSPPAPGATNVYLAPGALTPAALMADIADGFYVTELLGSGVNGVTGDYSRGAAGFRIQNGVLTHAVSEVTIAGTLQDMFRAMVPANDLIMRYGVNAPTIRIDGLTVAGA